MPIAGGKKNIQKREHIHKNIYIHFREGIYQICIIVNSKSQKRVLITTSIRVVVKTTP